MLNSYKPGLSQDPHLGFGVVRASEICRVALLESDVAPLWLLFIIVEYAASRVDCQVYASLMADVREIEGTDDICTDGLNLQSLALSKIVPKVISKT